MKFESNVFKFWRTERRMTLEEVGKAVGASKQTVSKWESGQVVPREAKIRAIAKLFNISVYDISDLAPEPEYLSRTSLIQSALDDPMFGIVVQSWNNLTAADKGEVIEFIHLKLKKQED